MLTLYYADKVAVFTNIQSLQFQRYLVQHCVLGQPRTGAFHRPLPSPRLISSKMSAAISEQSKVFSQLVPFWGQFIVHDIALTPLNEKRK